MAEADLRFLMPEVDAAASTEVGVILLGFDVERLLAGLGMAALADDPAAVTLAVDQVRHGAPPRPSFAALIDAGLARWVGARAGLAGSAPVAASPRQAWAQAERVVAGVEPAATGPASRAYLTACLVRHTELDRWVEEHR